jgi:ribonucleoside-diphosphate reductase alpha subunit
MFVIKRDGTPQPIDFEKIHWRIKSMCALPDILAFQKTERPEAYAIFSKLTPIYNANVDAITKKTIEGIYNNIPTTEIDKLSAEIAQEMCTIHPDNSVLATRILVSNLQKNVLEHMIKRFPKVPETILSENLFSYVMLALYFNWNKHGEHAPLVSPYVVAIANIYKEKIQKLLDFSRDFNNHDYLGIKTLEKGYLFRVHSMDNFAETNIILETPSMSDLRIAIGIACAPTPCPELYADAASFISSHPEVVKEKHRKDLVHITSHKDKRVNTKLFKSAYWEDQLNKELNSLKLKDSQWEMICNIYNGMSTGKFTPATPTRFSAGTLNPQGSSCFLIAMKDDSLKGIYETLLQQSQISKHAGGVGVWVSSIRSTGSYISGTGGSSEGLKPMLQVFDASSKYVNQGGRRPGSTAIYVEPWHADILTFIKLKRKKGADSDRARELFYALWIPDEFFRCWKDKKDWYLFDPSVVPKLYDSYDAEFSSTYLSDEFLSANKEKFLFTYRYRKYIRQGKYEAKISPESLMEEVVETVKDSGVPYMLAKDACNRKSNQKNLGVIKSSNLCTEIIQYSDEKETAVCNLSSICLNKFVREWREGDSESFKYNASLIEGENKFLTFDWDSFATIVRTVQNNIDRLIDLNYYPTPEARTSNMRHRPQATGVQGEADMMAMFRLPWNSKEANKLRFYIFERMYYECLKASVQLSKVNGPYESFSGSPASFGKLQFDLWKDEGKKISFPFTLPWDDLKEEIKLHGLRNSLFVAPMPTASTSSIMSNSSSIEPFNSLVYIRKAGSGDVTIMNKNLVNDLMSLNLWSKAMSDMILQNHGSIQDIIEIPKKLRDSYLTAYDLEPEDIIDAAFVRAWFVDQSQSMNLFFKNVTMSELSKAWTRGWMRGLKTLSYYSRTRGAITAQKAQINLTPSPSPISSMPVEGKVCSRENSDCLSCGS